MNIKNDKGMTLVVLAITVILLVILAYVTIDIGINMGESAKFESIKTNMLLIQSKCEVIANEKEIGEIDESGFYGEKQGDTEWYKLSQGDLNDMGLEKADAKDRLLRKL